MMKLPRMLISSSFHGLVHGRAIQSFVFGNTKKARLSQIGATDADTNALRFYP